MPFSAKITIGNGAPVSLNRNIARVERIRQGIDQAGTPEKKASLQAELKRRQDWLREVYDAIGKVLD